MKLAQVIALLLLLVGLAVAAFLAFSGGGGPSLTTYEYSLTFHEPAELASLTARSEGIEGWSEADFRWQEQVEDRFAERYGDPYETDAASYGYVVDQRLMQAPGVEYWDSGWTEQPNGDAQLWVEVLAEGDVAPLLQLHGRLELRWQAGADVSGDLEWGEYPPGVDGLRYRWLPLNDNIAMNGAPMWNGYLVEWIPAAADAPLFGGPELVAALAAASGLELTFEANDHWHSFIAAHDDRALIVTLDDEIIAVIDPVALPRDGVLQTGWLPGPLMPSLYDIAYVLSTGAWYPNDVSVVVWWGPDKMPPDDNWHDGEDHDHDHGHDHGESEGGDGSSDHSEGDSDGANNESGGANNDSDGAHNENGGAHNDGGDAPNENAPE